MTVPAYTTDLGTFTQAESGTWSELASPYNAGGTPASETDYFIQNTGCMSQSLSASKSGLIFSIAFDAGSDQASSIPSGDVVLFWQVLLPGNAMDTFANGGLRLFIGADISNGDVWISGGSDFGRNPYGGWQNVAIDPRYNSSTPDYTIGTPTAVWRWFGSILNTTAVVSKGNPHAVDAIRYGRAELIVLNGEAADYATFAGMATQNDAIANRWGLFQTIPGGYLWKGLMTLGQSGTLVDFRDSNRNIVIDDTPRTYTAFNRIEINNASSRVDWTSIQISALGTFSPGQFEVIDNADVNFDSCTFADMSTFIFQAQSTVIDTMFRRCGLITTGGGTFTGCVITNSTAANNMTASSPANAALVSGCTFISDGTGHGLEITGTAANFTLTDDTWTGYAGSDGSTGNEAVYVNIASGSLNLTITGGTTPSVRTAGCTVTKIVGAVSATVTCKTPAGAAIENARVFLKADSGGPFPQDVTVTIANSGTTATVTHTTHGLATNDKVLIDGASHWQNNGVFSITNTGASTYTYTMPGDPGSSPTGTIKSTFVILEGLTNASGIITMSRVFGSAQPCSGWARKSSGAPYYKTAVISGSVSSTLGFDSTVTMILDQ